jgi:hypothetical protein
LIDLNCAFVAINWVYQMLKSTIGSALLVYSPTRKAQEEWCTDLAKALHSSILHIKSKIDKLEESNQANKGNNKITELRTIIRRLRVCGFYTLTYIGFYMPPQHF